jgi:hypothetical protein
MMEKDDGRVQNQADWLAGIVLTYGRFRQTTEDDDHKHCEFCWAKFLDPEYRAVRSYDTPQDVLTEGYHTLDGYRWICSRCYEDFREMFGWKTVEEHGRRDRHRG